MIWRYSDVKFSNNRDSGCLNLCHSETNSGTNSRPFAESKKMCTVTILPMFKIESLWTERLRFGIVVCVSVKFIMKINNEIIRRVVWHRYTTYEFHEWVYKPQCLDTLLHLLFDYRIAAECIHVYIFSQVPLTRHLIEAFLKDRTASISQACLNTRVQLVLKM